MSREMILTLAIKYGVRLDTEKLNLNNQDPIIDYIREGAFFLLVRPHGKPYQVIGYNGALKFASKKNLPSDPKERELVEIERKREVDLSIAEIKEDYNLHLSRYLDSESLKRQGRAYYDEFNALFVERENHLDFLEAYIREFGVKINYNENPFYFQGLGWDSENYWVGIVNASLQERLIVRTQKNSAKIIFNIGKNDYHPIRNAYELGRYRSLEIFKLKRNAWTFFKSIHNGWIQNKEMEEIGTLLGNVRSLRNIVSQIPPVIPIKKHITKPCA